MKEPLCFPAGRVLTAFLSIVFPAFGASPELPDDLPVTDGLVVFLDAEAFEEHSGHVTRVLDRSGRENDAWEIREGVQPRKPIVNSSATPSGADAIHFDGVGGYMEVASNPEDFDGRAKTTFVVFRPDDLAASGRILNSGYLTVNADNPALDTNYRVENILASAANGGTLTSSFRDDSDGNVFVRTPDESLAAGSFYVGMTRVSEEGDLVVAVRSEGNQRLGNEVAGGTAVPEGHLMTWIGAFSAFREKEPSNFFPGDIAAVLIYNRALSTAEVADVEEYLVQVYLGTGPDGVEGVPVTEGLVLHLNSEAVLEADGYVEQMIDLSGRGNHAVSHLADGLRPGPVYIAEATPARRGAFHFDGAAQYLQINGKSSDFDGRGKTTLVVFRPEVLDGVGTMINSAYADLGASGPQYLVHRMRNGPNASFQVQNRTETGGSVLTGTSNVLTEGEFHLGINWWTDGGDTFSVLRTAQNERYISDASGANANPQGHLWTRLGVRSGATSDDFRDFFDGDIAAVLVYNRALLPFEVFEMEEYLYNRYLKPMSFEEWIAGFGLPLHLQTPDSDVSGDGVSNLEKYAFGMSPLVASRAGLPRIDLLRIEGGEEEILLAWDMQGTDTVRAAEATAVAPIVAPSTIILGPGLVEQGLANALSATGWGEEGAGFSSSLGDGHWFEFTVEAAEGVRLALSTLEVNLRRASRGAQTVQWGYSTDGVTFNPIEPPIAVTVSGGDGAFYDPVDLSAIQELQGVESVTFRLVGWDARGEMDASRTLALGRLSGENLLLTGSAVPEATGSFAMITVQKDANAVGVNIEVETSSDLVSWSSENIVIMEESEAILRARLANPTDAQSSTFLRTKVTRAD